MSTTEMPKADAPMSVAAWLRRVHASAEGLSENEAAARLRRFGYNRLDELRQSPILRLLSVSWRPAASLIEVASVVAIVTHRILALILLAATLIVDVVAGSWQEARASRASEAVKKHLAPTARVKRAGRWREIEADLLVPGDIVQLRAGGIAPADLLLLGSEAVRIDESSLAGEGASTTKSRGDLVHTGSIARDGATEAVVTHTGAQTSLGRKAEFVSSARPGSKLPRAAVTIGNTVITAGLALAALSFLIVLLRGAPLSTELEFALIVLVTAIPFVMRAVVSMPRGIGAPPRIKMPLPRG